MRSNALDWREQLVENIAITPMPTVDTVGGVAQPWSNANTAVATAAFMPDAYAPGVGAMRSTRIATGAYAHRMAFNQIPILWVTTPRLWSVSFLIRASLDAVGGVCIARTRQGTGTANNLHDQSFSLTSGWQQVKYQTTLILQTAGLLSVQLIMANGVGPVGSWIETTRLMVAAPNRYGGDYHDGNDVNWKWRGTPNASICVGYP